MTLREQLGAIWDNYKRDMHKSEDIAIEAIKMRIPVGSVVKFYKSKMVVMSYTEDRAILYKQTNNNSDSYNIRELTENISDIVGTVSEEWLTTMKLLR